MIRNDITTMKDVDAFIERIAEEVDDFHPLADFNSYLQPDSYFRRYTDSEAEDRNDCLEKCVNVCALHNPEFFNYLLRLFEQKKAKQTSKGPKRENIKVTATQGTQQPLFAD